MFPINDLNWLEVDNFIQSNLEDNDQIVAPSEFTEVLKNCSNYQSNSVATDFQWFVLHKGIIDKIDDILLQRVLDRMNPVYGNPVFVVFSTHQKLSTISKSNVHLIALFEQIHQKKLYLQVDKPSNKNHMLSKIKSSDKLATTHQDVIFDIREIGQIQRTALELICRSASQSAYLGDNTLLCRILTKYFCYVDATDISLTPHLLLNGYWEIWITQLFSRVIQPGWNCIDIGANCGYYTLLMADLVGNSGRVLAVEPNPTLASLVDRSIQVNGFKPYTEVIAKAASNRVGETTQLCVPDELLGNATIYHPTASDVQNLPSHYFSITTTTVDELAKSLSHVDFIKIDTEGAEWLIWQGMQETLSKNPNLIIIIEFSNYRLDYYNPREFLTEIVNTGFSLNYIDGDSTTQSITFDECLANKDEFIDLVLIR
jgi:FkbM family methyltransferase